MNRSGCYARPRGAARGASSDHIARSADTSLRRARDPAPAPTHGHGVTRTPDEDEEDGLPTRAQPGTGEPGEPADPRYGARGSDFAILGRYGRV
jgi:hypothetical protein